MTRTFIAIALGEQARRPRVEIRDLADALPDVRFVELAAGGLGVFVSAVARQLGQIPPDGRHRRYVAPVSEK